MKAAFIAAAALSGLLAGALCAWLFCRLPAGWLCDYGETPPQEAPAERARFSREGLQMGLVLAILFALLAVPYPPVNASFYIYCAAAILLGLCVLADCRYAIIPDELVLGVFVCGALHVAYDAFHGLIFYGTWLSPLGGAAGGALLWVILGLLGRAVYHKESVGGGDMKLFAALGFLCGSPAVFFAFVFMILAAGIHFSVLLARKKISPEQYMPMAPYIFVGSMAAIVLHEPLLQGIQRYLAVF